jgi:hypothetical protein
MTAKVRKQIYIESDQEIALKRLARQTGLSEAEIIRRAVDRHMRQFRSRRHDLRAWDKERAFIERLIQQGPVTGERTWQREDLYER